MIEDLQQAKARCLADLTAAMAGKRYRQRLDAIDARLAAYIDDALSNEASHANLYELLGIRKVLRLMDSYQLDPQRVQKTLRAIEGQWKNGRHEKGGLRFDTPRGNRHVRLMPYQVWCVFGIYAFVTEVSMERPYTEGDALLPTEYRGEDGNVWDRRRLTQEAHLFQTRKSGKTEFGGAIDFVEVCFLGPANGQALICSPSAETSQIAYRAIKEFAMQVDPTCVNRMGGKFFRMTRNGMNWQPGHRMKGDIRTMAAGKTPKDGLYASVVHADEHGQARYINGRSDMQAAVETCWGSTGPRREKLLIHTTTAGNVSEGPYKSKIESVEASLLRELEIPLDGQPHRTDDDQWFALLFELDKWEITDDLDRLDNPELFRKVNRSIGTTVQPTYYRERLHEARNSDDTKKEVMTKDFNMWQMTHTEEWIKPEQARGFQVDMTIEQCTQQEGWVIFCGLDFSQGDDLHTAGYLAARRNPRGGTEFLCDFDAWIKQSTLQQSSIRPLYELWVSQGWLHVSEGETFQPALFIRRLDDLIRMGCQFQFFGYDPYRYQDPINSLKAYLAELGVTAPEQYVVPVSQRNANYTAAVDQMTAALFDTEPFMHMSRNPMWPWLFGNCVLDKDRMENVKPVKRNPGSDSCKVDPIQTICSALNLFNRLEGSAVSE